MTIRNKDEFERVLGVLVEETMGTSLINRIMETPRYNHLLSVGPAAVPWLMEHIERRASGGFWICLSLLRKLDAFPPEVPPIARGRLHPLRAHWLRWWVTTEHAWASAVNPEWVEKYSKIDWDGYLDRPILEDRKRMEHPYLKVTKDSLDNIRLNALAMYNMWTVLGVDDAMPSHFGDILHALGEATDQMERLADDERFQEKIRSG